MSRPSGPRTSTSQLGVKGRGQGGLPGHCNFPAEDAVDDRGRSSEIGHHQQNGDGYHRGGGGGGRCPGRRRWMAIDRRQRNRRRSTIADVQMLLTKRRARQAHNFRVPPFRGRVCTVWCLRSIRYRKRRRPADRCGGRGGDGGRCTTSCSGGCGGRGVSIVDLPPPPIFGLVLVFVCPVSASGSCGTGYKTLVPNGAICNSVHPRRP